MITGEKIRQQRRLLDMKQEELSRLVGVSLKTVQRWENGERSPRVEEMNRLAEALRVSPAYLMGTDELAVQSEKSSVSESQRQERNTNMAVITLDGGRKVEAPATPEGYAFLERLFLASMGRTAVTV